MQLNLAPSMLKTGRGLLIGLRNVGINAPLRASGLECVP